MKYVYAMQVL